MPRPHPCDPIDNRIGEIDAILSAQHDADNPGDDAGPGPRPHPLPRPKKLTPQKKAELEAELIDLQKKLVACYAINPPYPPPKSASFVSDIQFPTGTAITGKVTFTVYDDGRYEFAFGMRDTGLIGYEFVVAAVFVPQSGVAIGTGFSGQIAGTISMGGNRNAGKSVSGESPLINPSTFPSYQNGRLLISREYSATGVAGILLDIGSALLSIASTVVGATIGAVIWIGSGIGQLFNLGIGATFGVIGGFVVFAFGGGFVMGLIAGVAIGAIVNELIKQRTISGAEYEFANKVFGGTLPQKEKIVITNMTGLGGSAFVIPGVDGKIYMNLGNGYDDPIKYRLDQYPRDGQVFIHEMTHVWQVHHSKFIPGLICSGISNQTSNMVGGEVYTVGAPGELWSNINLESQASIVDQWFEGRQTVHVPKRAAEDPNDPYYFYIRDNIRAGHS